MKKADMKVDDLKQKLKSMIIFENDHVIVINKPNGVPS